LVQRILPIVLERGPAKLVAEIVKAVRAL